MSSTPIAHKRLSQLQMASFALTLIAVVQAGLGIGIASSVRGLRFSHTIVAASFLLVGALVTFLAWRWSKVSSRNRKGVVMHAASIPVLALVQWALGETGPTIVHIILGFALLIAAVSMIMVAPRARRQVQEAQAAREADLG